MSDSQRGPQGDSRRDPGHDPGSSADVRPVDGLEARVEELEVRLAHLDYALQSQGEELLHLQQTNTLLTQQLRELAERLRALAEAASGDPSLEPPPPHY